MKLKLALLTADSDYGKRLFDVLNWKYAERVAARYFTAAETALDYLRENSVDILLADEDIGLPDGALPRRCILARLCERKSQRDGDDTRIAKYQKVGDMLKDLQSLYADRGDVILDFAAGDLQTAVITFASPAGGCGSSTAAAACALHLARHGKKVLYLGCELFGTADHLFMDGQEREGLGRLLFYLKSKSAALNLKLEGLTVSREGVDYIAACDTVMNLMTVSGENVEYFTELLRSMGRYDAVIFDTSFVPGAAFWALLGCSHRVVVTLDGSRQAQRKFERAVELLRAQEGRSEHRMLDKLRVLYNRVASKGADMPANPEFPVLGGVNRIEGGSDWERIQAISGKDVFSTLLNTRSRGGEAQ